MSLGSYDFVSTFTSSTSGSDSSTSGMYSNDSNIQSRWELEKEQAVQEAAKAQSQSSQKSGK